MCLQKLLLSHCWHPICSLERTEHVWTTPSFPVNSPSGGLLERIKVKGIHKHDTSRSVWLEFACLGHRDHITSGGLSTYLFFSCFLAMHLRRLRLSLSIIALPLCLQIRKLRLRNIESATSRAGIKTYLFLSWNLFPSIPYYFPWSVNAILKERVIWGSPSILLSWLSLETTLLSSHAHQYSCVFVFSNDSYEMFNMYCRKCLVYNGGQTGHNSCTLHI